jgi:hypothetical protein
LIVEKGRALSEKWLEYSIFELFSNRKWSWTRSMARWNTGGASPRCTADGGSPEDGRNGAPVRRTSPRLRKKGERMAVILTGYRRGWQRVGSDRAAVGKKWRRKRSVRAALGLGKKRKRAGGGAVKDDGALPFYRGRGGERRPGMVVDGSKWAPSWLPLPGVKGGDYSRLKSGRVMGVTVGAP